MQVSRRDSQSHPENPSTQNPNDPTTPNGDDTARLVRELEAQNAELSRMRQELEAAYLKYADLYDFAPVGYFTLSRQGTIKQVNLAGASLLGKSPAQLLNQPLMRFISSESQSAFVTYFDILLKGDSLETCELAFTKNGDGPLWVRIEANCFGDGDECNAAMMDISQRKRMERDLQESEWRSRIVSELTTDYIFVVDANPNGSLDLRWASNSMLTLTGRTVEEVASSNLWTDIIYPDDRSNFFSFVNITLKTGQAGLFECRTLTKPGDERWVEILVRPQVDQAGKVTSIIGAVKDITQRKRMDALIAARMRISEYLPEYTLDQVLQKLLDEAEALTGSQVGFIHFLEADQKTLTLQMWSTNTLGICQAEGKGQHYPVEEAGIWADCVRTRAPLIHNDYPAASNRKGLPEGHTLINRELIIPVLRNDQVVMIMGVGNKTGQYGPGDMETLSQLANLAWDMVQRKKAEEALEISEKKYRLLHESMIDGFVSVDMAGNFVEYNEIYREMLGYSDEEMVSLTYVDITPEKWHHYEKNIVENQILARGYSDIYEKEYRRKDGTFFPVELHTVLLRNENGSPSGMWAIVRDVTERKRNEQALVKSEEMIRNINNNLIHGMIYQLWRMPDGTRKFTYLSDAVQSLYGITPQQGMDDPELIYGRLHPDDRHRLLAEEEEAFRTLSVFKTETRIINPDESVRWSSFISNPQVFPDGSSCWDGIELDITERKRAEEELRRLSTHDALTGLYNRSFFEAEMARLERSREYPISIMMVDVDGMKATNDQEGHPAGDLLLKRVAQVLGEVFRSEDIVARIGGDEFAVILPSTDADAAKFSLLRVQQTIKKHNNAYQGTALQISLGVSTAETRIPLAEVFKAADMEMYHDKRKHAAARKRASQSGEKADR